MRYLKTVNAVYVNPALLTDLKPDFEGFAADRGKPARTNVGRQDRSRRAFSDPFGCLRTIIGVRGPYSCVY